ncbi:MAG: glutathione S-transferase [Robiginitomaculum sp.]|nr:MAG: glutathione S-transferase [Robiginitomaculum sp.]
MQTKKSAQKQLLSSFVRARFALYLFDNRRTSPVAPSSALPTLYSFRRCPYAMRARLGLLAASQTVELREVSLKSKPQELLALSPKATVPVLDFPGSEPIEQSLQIMLWPLDKNDPQGLLQPANSTLDTMLQLIERNDGPFKTHLDRYKYPNRYEPVGSVDHRAEGFKFLTELSELLTSQQFLFGSTPSLADLAIFPFVRQFAGVDREWFEQTAPQKLRDWLAYWLATNSFVMTMHKYTPWQRGDTTVLFPIPEAAHEV